MTTPTIETTGPRQDIRYQRLTENVTLTTSNGGYSRFLLRGKTVVTGSNVTLIDCILDAENEGTALECLEDGASITLSYCEIRGGIVGRRITLKNSYLHGTQTSGIISSGALEVYDSLITDVAKDAELGGSGITILGGDVHEIVRTSIDVPVSELNTPVAAIHVLGHDTSGVAVTDSTLNGGDVTVKVETLSTEKPAMLTGNTFGMAYVTSQTDIKVEGSAIFSANVDSDGDTVDSDS